MKDAPLRERLARLSRLLQADDRASADLLPVQLQALHYLARCNRFSDTPAAVAEYLGITKGTASQTLKVLVHAGLVSRQPDRADRRLVHLRLTDEGLDLVESSRSTSIVAAAVEELAAADRQALDAGLAALVDALRDGTGARTFGVCGSCRYFRGRARTGFHCGLLHEPLSSDDSRLICREHELPTTSATVATIEGTDV